MKIGTIHRSEVLTSGQALTGNHIQGLFNGQILGLLKPGVLPESVCKMCALQVRAQSESTRYAGNLATGIGVPTWSIRAERGDTPEAWHAYFASVPAADALRQQIFEPIIGCDPLDLLMALLQAAWPHPVVRGVHQHFGRKLNGCLVRGGVALPHHDEAGRHAGLESLGHIGVVLVLDAMQGAYQRIWPVKLEPNDEETYPMDEPVGVPYLDIPTPVGSVSFLSAVYRHKVQDDDRRLTVAIHVSLHPSGQLVVYA
jgi:hypothetical protein